MIESARLGASTRARLGGLVLMLCVGAGSSCGRERAAPVRPTPTPSPTPTPTLTPTPPPKSTPMPPPTPTPTPRRDADASAGPEVTLRAAGSELWFALEASEVDQEQDVVLAWSDDNGGPLRADELRVALIEADGRRVEARTLRAGSDGLYRWRWPRVRAPMRASLTLHGVAAAPTAAQSRHLALAWPPRPEAAASRAMTAHVDKPRQWADGVRTELASVTALREGVALPLTVAAADDAGAPVVAPIAGVLGRAGGRFLTQHSRVRAQDALFVLVPDAPPPRGITSGCFRPEGGERDVAAARLVASAPIDGYFVVGARPPRPGLRVEAGELLGRVVADSDLELRSRRPAAASERLGAGADVVVVEDVESAIVRPVVERSGGELRARLPEGHGLRPGQVVVGQLRDGAGRRALSLPRRALLRRGVEHAVWVATSATRFAYREVVVGADGGERVEVVDGLDAGERVVVAGHDVIEAAWAAMRQPRSAPAAR